MMRALSIRQPWAELILRGVKTIEYRNRPTRIIGERFLIYAAGKWPAGAGARREMEQATRVWSRDLAMPDGDEKSAWMIKLMAELMGRNLPTGVIVGSALIDKVTPPETDGGLYRWHLAGVERARELTKPAGHPQPGWFLGGRD